jgi:hypothetical protein
VSPEALAPGASGSASGPFVADDRPVAGIRPVMSAVDHGRAGEPTGEPREAITAIFTRCDCIRLRGPRRTI